MGDAEIEIGAKCSSIDHGFEIAIAGTDRYEIGALGRAAAQWRHLLVL
ncbi:MAG: hypothetical protein MO846_10155 [Candidatus Devosia symbiotica]|nr:hypothetical protein [Candidatus Devosia symbiotica]